MKVIFLDIDGVLNHEYCKALLHGIYFVEDEKVLLLKELINATAAKVVLTSTWRMGWHDIDEEKNTQNAKDFLALKEKLAEGIYLLDISIDSKNSPGFLSLR